MQIFQLYCCLKLSGRCSTLLSTVFSLVRQYLEIDWREEKEGEKLLWPDVNDVRKIDVHVPDSASFKYSNQQFI